MYMYSIHIKTYAIKTE